MAKRIMMSLVCLSALLMVSGCHYVALDLHYPYGYYRPHGYYHHHHSYHYDW